MSNPQPQSGEPANWHIARSLARQAIHRLIPGLPRIRTEKDAEGYLLQGAILSQLTYLFTYSLYDAKLSSSYLLNAINALEHTIASPMLAQAYFQMALGAQIAGLLRLARVYFRLGQQTLDQLTITDSHDFFLTLVYKAYAELSFGHLSTSEQTSLQGAEMLERLNTKLWFRVLNFPNLGLTYRFMGRFHESKAVGHKLVEYATTPLKLRQAISGGQAIIAQAAIRLHQLDEASDVLERRRELEETMRAGNESSTYLTYDTLLAWRRGDIPEVERLLPLAVDEVIDYTEQITAHEHAAIFNTFEVCLQLWESGQSSLTNLPELTERIRKLAKQYAKRHVAGRARYYWMEGLYAFNQGKGRRAAAHWKRAIDYANQTGAAYERAVAEYYLYRYITPDAGKLQDVRRAFEEIGAVWDAERIT